MLNASLDDFAEVTSREQRQSDRAAELLIEIDRYMSEYARPVLSIAQENSLGAARAATKDEGPIRINEIQRTFKRFLDAENVLAESRKESADAKSRHAIELGVAGLAGSTALILLFGFYLSRSIARPVREAAEGATRFAGGRSFPAPLAERPGRDRRAQDGVQPHGGEPRARRSASSRSRTRSFARANA